MKTILPLIAAATLILAASACKKEQPDICPDCPVITSITPASGAPGTLVTIRGINFEGLEYVVFDGDTQLPVVPDSTTATKTSILAPDLGKNGPVKVTVIRKFSSGGGGTFSLESKEDITFTYLLGPEISGFSPQTGKKGDVITITGRYFGANPEVFFPNGEAAAYQQISDTLLMVEVPSKAGVGPIRVTTADGFSTESAAIFNYQYGFSFGLFLGAPGQPGFVINVPAADARLENITLMASDAEGNLYLVDQYTSTSFDIMKVDKAPPHIVTRVAEAISGFCTQLVAGPQQAIYFISQDPSTTVSQLFRQLPGQSPFFIYSSEYLEKSAIDSEGEVYLFLGGSNAGIYKTTGSFFTKEADVTDFYSLTKTYTIGNYFFFDNSGEFQRFDLISKNITPLYSLPLYSIHAWAYSPFTNQIYFGTNNTVRVKNGGVMDVDDTSTLLIPELSNVFAAYMEADVQGNLYIRKFGADEQPCLYKATLE